MAARRATRRRRVTEVVMSTRVSRTCWQATALLLAAHFTVRARSPRAFAVQVRIGYLALLLLGLWPPLSLPHVVQFAGVNALLTVDDCPLARLLVLAPWNRRIPFSAALVRWTLFSPLAPGAIVDRVPRELATLRAAAHP
jgi:hypothetical protein